MVTDVSDETEPGLIQVGLYLRTDQKERLRQDSFERRLSGSEIVRDALDAWWAKKS